MRIQSDSALRGDERTFMVTVERLEDRRLLSASPLPVLPVGSLAPTFGYEGAFAFNNPYASRLPDHLASAPSAIQPDGKMLEGDGSVDRFNADGTPDTTFGNQGRAAVPNARFGSAVVQPDGRVVAAGTALARFMPDGQVDPTFNTSDVLPGAIVFDVTLDRAGDILVAGNYSGGSLSPGARTKFAIARYLPDGTPDGSFGAGGAVTVNAPNGATGEGADAIAVQPDGGVVVINTIYPASGAASVIVQRFDSKGQIDNTFGTGGAVRPDLPVNGGVTNYVPGYYFLAGGQNGIGIEPGGRIVLSVPSPQGLWLEGLRPDGTVDLQFARSGRILVAGKTASAAATVSPDGQIGFAICTVSRSRPGHPAQVVYYTNWRVGRLSADGRVDRRFASRQQTIVTEFPSRVTAMFTPGGNLVSFADPFYLKEYLARRRPPLPGETATL